MVLAESVSPGCCSILNCLLPPVSSVFFQKLEPEIYHSLRTHLHRIKLDLLSAAPRVPHDLAPRLLSSSLPWDALFPCIPDTIWMSLHTPSLLIPCVVGSFWKLLTHS